ncbi:MAG: class I SAM-dependent methyltransferase [Candidatus Thiodiazotropha sp.]
MNTISNTAYYCCGIRMEDARKNRSICKDVYAERFMDERGKQIFEPFKSEKMPNISNIVRCRLIDDYLATELAENNKLTIITVGAGFDTRPYRSKGGIWIEIDEPQIINYKNERLPVQECSNPLSRISIDFTHDSLSEKLREESSENLTVIIIEGVFMYLEPEAIRKTICSIQGVFPRHVLYCDLMTKRFFTKFAQSVHSKLVASGGRFTERPDFPEKIFFEHDYKEIERIPMFKRAGELGLLWDEVKIPKFVSWLMLNLFARDLNGYAVHRLNFEKT